MMDVRLIGQFRRDVAARFPDARVEIHMDQRGVQLMVAGYLVEFGANEQLSVDEVVARLKAATANGDDQIVAPSAWANEKASARADVAVRGKLLAALGPK